jgi:four helix bundle protein
MTDTPILNHENLDAYQAAVQLLALAHQIIGQIPRGHGVMVEQLRKASLSIPLNIAEGYGKRTAADQAKYYDIARGSAHECGALVDAAKVLGFIDEQIHSSSKTLLHRIVSMLVRMVRL